MLAVLCCPVIPALDLRALPDFLRPNPFEIDSAIPSIKLTAARDGYVSAHLVALLDAPAEYQLAIEFPLATDLYREWYHFNTPDRRYYADALIPVKPPYRSVSPSPTTTSKTRSPKPSGSIWIPRKLGRMYIGAGLP
ncbi:MAG: hypothetical protein WKF37_14580 [Bryobacteraceae bacterium]